jgi:hypothetical protein
MEPMLVRLLIGIVKGLLVGGLVGFGLAKLGFAAPGAVIAYAAAALTGVLVGLIAGKPIWAKDAKIEAGMKAFFGALLGAGLMFVARRWLTMPVPVPLGELGGANSSLGEVARDGTFGGLALTSLAAIAALLGGFYEADNTPSDDDGAAARPASKRASAGNRRIAASTAGDDLDEDLEAEPDQRRTKK